MAENPNITATDEDGNELENTKVEVNGLVPGSGGGGETVETAFDVGESGATATEATYDFDGASIENLDTIHVDVAVDDLQESTAAASEEIDVSAAGTHDLTVDQATEISFTGAGTDGIYSVTVIIERTSDVSITWASNVEWDGGNAPDLSGTGVAIITALTRDGGESWQAFIGGTNFS